MNSFPSILALTELIKTKSISIVVLETSPFSTEWFKVELRIGSDSFTFHVDDEYGDLKRASPELRLCVSLKSLEEINGATDFLDWCRNNHINANDSEARDYFKSVCHQLSKIESLIGPLDSQISDLDFSLNSGAAQFLRSIG